MTAQQNQKPAKSLEHKPGSVEETYHWLVRHGSEPLIVGSDGAPVSEQWGDPERRPALMAFGEAIGGSLHQHFTDTDQDCDETRYFGAIFLPHTPCVFGRPGNPASRLVDHGVDGAILPGLEVTRHEGPLALHQEQRVREIEELLESQVRYGVAAPTPLFEHQVGDTPGIVWAGRLHDSLLA